MDRSSTRRHVLLLSAATLACLLPFLNRAFNIDEPLFLWLGEHLRREPWDFYGFDVNWNGWPQPMHEITQNPPLAGYLIAAWAALVGTSEPALHAVFVLPALAAVLGTYFLARRFCTHPHAAALIALATPVFLVSATTVMCDVLMLAWFVWALWAWIEGLERGRTWLLVLSGVLALLAALTKYFGLAVVPLCLAWTIFEHRRPRAAWLALLVPVLGVAAFEWRAHALYGHGLLAGATEFASRAIVADEPGAGARTMIGLLFAGGCFAPALVYLPLFWSRAMLLAGAALVAVLAFGWSGAQSFGPIDLSEPAVEVGPGLRFQLLAWTLSGVSLLALAVLDVVRRRDRASALLALWLVGTYAFAAYLNWTNNGRSILPLVPPAAILLVRALETRLTGARPALTLAANIAFAPCLALAVLVAWADARSAGSARDAARELIAQHSTAPLRSGPLWFQGHWGFQYYMQLGGARPMNLQDGTLLAGERIATMQPNVANIRMPPEETQLVARLTRPAPTWVRTHSPRLRAGFYATNFGPLPFAFGSAPEDRFLVHEAQREIRFVGFRSARPATNRSRRRNVRGSRIVRRRRSSCGREPGAPTC